MDGDDHHAPRPGRASRERLGRRGANGGGAWEAKKLGDSESVSPGDED